MERALTANELNLFKTRRQLSKWYLAVHRTASLFYSTIAVEPDTHPASALVIDAAFNTGDATLTKKNHTVWIGALPGGSDEGVIRLRGPVNTATSIMPIAESGSGINRYYAGKFVTVVEDFRPMAIMSKYVPAASQWRVDYNVAYESHLEDYGPVIRMGPPVAGIMDDSGTLTASFVGGSTQFPNATISTATWNFPDGQTEARLGTKASPVVKVFNNASPKGAYFDLSVTDSTGSSSISRRLIYCFASKTDPAQVEFATITGGLELGNKATMRVLSGGNTDQFPDGAEILVFEETSYAGTAESIGGNYPFRSNIVYRGWTISDTLNINPFSGDVTFQTQDIQGYLEKTHSKDIFMAYSNPPTGTSEWIEAADLSIDRAAIMWGKYRSTVMEITDFVLASGLPMTGKIAFQDLPKSTLWRQLKANYGQKGVNWHVSADFQGAIYATEDVQISGLSATIPVAMHIEKQDRRDVVQIAHPHFEKNALVELYSVASTAYIGARSPGADAHGYFGGTKVHQRGLVVGEDPVAGQQTLTVWSGNMRAKLNNPYPKVTVPISGYLKLDATPQARVTMSLSATENVRGLEWSNKEFLQTKTTLQYDSMTGLPLTTIELEAVVNGKGGSAITFERIIPMSPQPVPIKGPPRFSGGSLIVFNKTIGTYEYS